MVCFSSEMLEKAENRRKQRLLVRNGKNVQQLLLEPMSKHTHISPPVRGHREGRTYELAAFLNFNVT